MLLAFSQNIFSQVQEPSEFLKIKKYKVGELGHQLKESSALIFVKEKLFSLNDSGNTSELFELNPKTAETIQNFKTNAQNVDWESLTSDGENFFVGDFGNNCGCRKDLSIYKIPFTGNLPLGYSKKIQFYYPEQKDFGVLQNHNDFDSEAMIFLNGKIHIFTKEWKSKKTTHYVVDIEKEGTIPAEKIESFDTRFLVTDASYFQGKLYLLGYTKKGDVFLYIFEENNGRFFDNPPISIYLGSALKLGQTEGIAVNNDGIYISCEKFRTFLGTVKPTLYFIPKEKLDLD